MVRAYPTEVIFVDTEKKEVRLRKVKKLPKGMEMPLDEMISLAGSKKKKRQD